MIRPTTLLTTLGAAMVASTLNADQSVSLYAAGSLRSALDEVAEQYAKTYQVDVAATFGPSGLLRQRIESGEPAQVFASANMSHPQALAEQRAAGPVVMFARNRLCALAQQSLDVSTQSLLDVLLDSSVRVGTSTPKADPSGDYAWQLFDKAGSIRPGAANALKDKALQLTGGPDSQKAPQGRNPYGWVMARDKADIFLTYCTNAVLSQREVPSLGIVQIPESLSVGADYGLLVLDHENAAAWRLAWYIMSPKGQTILAGYGFDAGGIPRR